MLFQWLTVADGTPVDNGDSGAGDDADAGGCDGADAGGRDDVDAGASTVPVPMSMAATVPMAMPMPMLAKRRCRSWCNNAAADAEPQNTPRRAPCQAKNPRDLTGNANHSYLHLRAGNRAWASRLARGAVIPCGRGIRKRSATIPHRYGLQSLYLSQRRIELKTLDSDCRRGQWGAVVTFVAEASVAAGIA